MAVPPLTYAFQPKEKIKEGFLRILGEIAQQGEDLAEFSSGPMEEPIHDGRLMIKRLRGLLWFARPSLSGEVIAQTKTALRDAAGLLGGHRDLAVAQATLKKLRKNASTSAERKALAETSQQLSKDPEATEMTEDKLRLSLKKAMDIVCRSVLALKQNVAHRNSWASPSRRLAKARQAQIKAGKKARRSGDDTDFHTWRKRAKLLFYQMELTQSVGGKKLIRAMKKVEELQARLGEYHDDVMVEGRLAKAGAPSHSAKRILKSLDREKTDLRRKATKIARRIKVKL